ncbi:hypothetical protein Tco_1056823 [Tanacetum coccineum]|uniref:Integrase, catalytic region, zinc finger, CCHC-type, peptidase aspartic, catalytic n=1 Tax=Tanacetum coccineum TaxID=301880 RepID=A0ABQ5H4M7_9ASTR
MEALMNRNWKHISSYMAKIQEVSPEESSSTGQPLEQVQNHDESNVYDNVRRHSEQPESINDTYVLEKDDSNVTPDSSNICTNDNQENKTIFIDIKKANASVTQELKKCKTNLDETNSALEEAISCRDSCLIALQNKQNEFEKYKAFNDRTIDYEILQTKLYLDTKATIGPKDSDALRLESVRINKIVQLILFIVDSGCTKHMTGNLKLLCDFVEKFLGTWNGRHQLAPNVSSSKLVPTVVPLANKTATSRQELELLFHLHIAMLRTTGSYALSWKPCQGDSLNLPDHRIHKDGDGDASFQLKSDSLPHAHAQSTKTFYKHQDSRIMKAQELKTKTSAQTLILKITPQKSSFGGDC